MKNLLITVLALAIILTGFMTRAQQVNSEMARQAADSWLLNSGHHIAGMQVISQKSGEPLGYMFDLKPAGYLALSAKQQLPAVIAYSFESNFRVPGEEKNPLLEILLADLENRYLHLDKIDQEERQFNFSAWEALLSGDYQSRTFEQWPPPGSTSTGGWVETNWSQSAPYNNMCPLDEVTGSRSVAGCPSIALAMIVNYQKNLNGTTFTDADDYYHSYAGRQYWIDDDAHVMEFPAFPEINEYFDTIANKFANHTVLNTNEIAALIFSCGVAARQVYTSEVSGTFGVDQAYDAYLKFGYMDAKLIYDTDTSFYTQMKHNMIDGIPVHLAVLSNTGQGGHNVVADGYNTDDYYHLNFGWGGSYNGWYLLPDEIPYNLTIIEGAVMDIGVSHVGIEQASTHNKFNFSIFPNPSRGNINIGLELSNTGELKLEILDISGKQIEQLHHGSFPAGEQNLKFKTDLTPGIYIISVSGKEFHKNKKLIIAK